MRLVIRTIWLTAALSTLAAGCGDDGDTTPSGPTGIPLEELPAKYAEAFCDTLQSCSGLFGEVLGEHGCKDEIAKQLEDTLIPQLETYIAGGTVVYHAEKVQACLDAVSTGGCDILMGVTPAVCEDALEGKVASGGNCNASSECAGADFCAFEGSTCPGVCTQPKSENSLCESDDHCQDGLTCQFDAMGERLCRKPAAAGEACDGASGPDCEAGLACIGAMGATSGTCKTFAQIQTKGLGDACNLDAGELCQEGLSCAVDQLGMPATFKCVGASATGAACRPGVPDPCPADEYCDVDQMSMNIDGICHKLPTDGQPCVEPAIPFGPICAQSHTCDGTKTCKARQQVGGACVEDEICYSDTCEGGKCVAHPACDAPEMP